MKLVANLRINYGLFYLLNCASKPNDPSDESFLNIKIVNSGMLTSVGINIGDRLSLISISLVAGH